MRLISKIEKDRDNQVREVHDNLKHREIPFWEQLRGLSGWFRLMLSRRYYKHEMVTVWETPALGVAENNTTIQNAGWYGFRYSVEGLRGCLARQEKNPVLGNAYNIFVYNAKYTGAYRVSGYFEINFGTQPSADFFAIGLWRIKLAVNWLPLRRIFAMENMIMEDGLATNKIHGWCYGGDIVWLNAGDKLTFHGSVVTEASIELLPFVIKSHIAINYLGKGTQKINQETTTWD